MTTRLLRAALVLACALQVGSDAATPASPDPGYELWLRYRPVADAARLGEYRTAITRLVVEGTSPTAVAARTELTTGLDGLLGTSLPVGGAVGGGTVLAGTPSSSPLIARLPLAAELGRLGAEGYLIRSVVSDGRRMIVIAANRDIGVLYGAFGLLRHLQTYRPLAGLAIESAPKLELRMLDHWDNPDGSIERGYAGRSLWKWSQLPDTLDPRYVDYARADASIGVNAVSLTNVNANTIFLTHEYLVKAAALASVFRPYGIRVFLTARFSSPVELGRLSTADPLDSAVQAWWKQKADEVYALIPDFGGFLMKANSEGQPGPKDYGRSHAQGANLIADALASHGGIVIWRAFVYSSAPAIDRVKQAYDEFTPLDGQFRPNVFVQVKNGPLDFQPREPFSPLLGAMPKTPLMMEVEITKEYLGQYSSLVYLGPMWTEVLNADTYAHGPGSTVARMLDGTLTHYPHTGMAGVANTGDDPNWCGSTFNQANWYAFGRLAWDPDLSAAAIADEWIRMTFTNDASFVEPVERMLLDSREAAVNYMTPLGLAHQFAGGAHYGPAPWDTTPPRADWTPPYYSRADTLGIGFDRTATGSNAVAQYRPPLDRRFGDRATVGDTLLLWFHHVVWTDRLPSGRTLWEELVRHYNMGVDTVRANLRTWSSLAGTIDQERFEEARANLEKEVAEARWWRDASLLYWQTFSKLPIPAEYEQPAHSLEFYEHLRCPTDPVHASCPEITGPRSAAAHASAGSRVHGRRGGTATARDR
jgi:alpha-glucuronidase